LITPTRSAPLLLAAANGQGHRRIAAELELPVDTVRGWLRRFRSQADVLHGLAVSFAFRADPGFQPPVPERSPLAACGRRSPGRSS